MIQILILVLVTRLTGIGYLRIIERIFRQQRYKCMTMNITRFCTFGNSWHMASYAVGKGMNRMGHVLVDLHMTFKTLPGACRVGL